MKNKDYIIGIVGLGYIGLPLLLLSVENIKHLVLTYLKTSIKLYQCY